MDLRLTDKVVVITHSASKIDAAITKLCICEGAQIVTVDSASENYSVLIEQTIRKHGRIDALVNIANRESSENLEQETTADFAADVRRRLSRHFNMAHCSLPHLKQSRGTIVNVVSSTSLKSAGTHTYDVCTGAILALTREWAAELVRFGIRVNAVVGNAQPTSSNSHDDEIAAIVAFLISSKSAHTTGQQIFASAHARHSVSMELTQDTDTI